MNTIKINSSNKYRSNRASNNDTDETEIAEKLTTIPPLKPRRILLKKSATVGIAGLLVPLEWSKPIINSVIMPSHAQTSDEVVVVSDDETTTTPTTQTSDEVVVVSDDEVTQAPTTQTPTTQPTTTVEPINIALSLDCNSTSSTLTGGDNGSVEITGTVVSSTPITDMTGIEITITLDPEDTFEGARDASNNIIESFALSQLLGRFERKAHFFIHGTKNISTCHFFHSIECNPRHWSPVSGLIHLGFLRLLQSRHN